MSLIQDDVEEDDFAGHGPLHEQRKDLASWVANVASLQEVEALLTLRSWLEDSVGQAVEVTHAIERGATHHGWVRCGAEGELCKCASGKVRYGAAGAATTEWAFSTNATLVQRCSKENFGNTDPAPGVVKVCECHSTIAMCEDGKPVDLARCPGHGELACRAGCDREFADGLAAASVAQVGRQRRSHANLCMDGRAVEPLWSCASRKHVDGHRHGHWHGEAAKEVLDRSTEQLCEDPEMGRQLEVFLDCEFVQQYRAYASDASDWFEEAYVTYVAGKKDSNYEWQATNLVRSVSLFSQRPIVVVAFGDDFVPPHSWYGLPNVIVYRMLAGLPDMSFNFNKIRAMVSVRATTGIMLDTDQIIFSGMDQVFNGTRREVVEHYPWPMLPVHWMSRDQGPENPYSTYAFKLYKANHTMRWNHAHPTWSFWSLPFLCDLLMERFTVHAGGDSDSDTPRPMRAWRLEDSPNKGVLSILRAGAQDERMVHWEGWMVEDEDMLNVNLWKQGADKAWCKFDLEPALFVSQGNVGRDLYADGKWYPDGLPLLFFSAHNTKQIGAMDWLLTLATSCWRGARLLRCPPHDTPLEICKVGSEGEREARQNPRAFASKACCCMAPLWARPVFWSGSWYKNTAEVPMVAKHGSGKERRCTMP